MTKIVLLAINAKYVHSSLSVWLIASGIAQFAKKTYDVRIVEATINQSLTDIVKAVSEHNPAVLGISAYIWGAGLLPELLVRLRLSLPDLTVILGGPEASNNTEYWLDNGADYVLCGEGEYRFPILLDEIFCKYTEASAPASTKDAAVLPIDPYTDEYFSALKGRLSYIETSRGCRYKCSFCLSGDSKLEFFPMETVKNRIKKLSKANTHTIKFVDRTFNSDAERAYEIFEYVIGLNSDCRYHFEVAADLFDGKTLTLLASAPPGLIQFEIGLQSFFEPALRASARQTNLKKATQNISTLLSFRNIHIHVDLIAGLPYETLAEFKSSFNQAYSLRAHTLQLGFLKLLHGSEMRNNAEVLGIKYSSQPPYEITHNKWLSSDDLHELKLTENALRHTYNKGRFLSAIDYVLTASNTDPYTLMNLLGNAAPNHGTQLENYILQVYNFFVTLPGIDAKILTDCLICDWLAMVKGKNSPKFLKNDDDRRSAVLAIAEKKLGRKVRREEYSVLHSGTGIFVDSNARDPVTGLYKLHFVEYTDKYRLAQRTEDCL